MLPNPKNSAAKPHKNRSESGNVLWLILIGVVLLGLLTAVLSRSGSHTDQSGDFEQMRIKASEIYRFARGLEAAIEQMKLRGVSENDISFENSKTATDYTNANCTAGDCKIFDVGGGGMSYRAPPSGVHDGSDWIFTGANNVGTAANPIGSTAAVTGNDIILLLGGVSTAFCTYINNEFGISGIPADTTGIATTAFTGGFSGLVVLDGDPSPFELDGKNAGCFADTPGATNYFYYVLLAR